MLTMFQSLFYWKSYCNIHVHATFKPIPFCFNPCFTGSLTATRKLVFFISQKKYCFNPCFTGSLTATIFWFQPKAPKNSFNPCFTGSLTATRHKAFLL